MVVMAERAAQWAHASSVPRSSTNKYAGCVLAFLCFTKHFYVYRVCRRTKACTPRVLFPMLCAISSCFRTLSVAGCIERWLLSSATAEAAAAISVTGSRKRVRRLARARVCTVHPHVILTCYHQFRRTMFLTAVKGLMQMLFGRDLSLNLCLILPIRCRLCSHVEPNAPNVGRPAIVHTYVWQKAGTYWIIIHMFWSFAVRYTFTLYRVLAWSSSHLWRGRWMCW